MARPKKEINQEIFENLCQINCTEEEVCAVLSVTDKTLARWCKETYQESFSEVYKRFAQSGKTSLRRAMWKNALKGNTTMQIWLSKNVLGMKESPDDFGYAEDSDALMESAGL